MHGPAAAGAGRESRPGKPPRSWRPRPCLCRLLQRPRGRRLPAAAPSPGRPARGPARAGGGAGGGKGSRWAGQQPQEPAPSPSPPGAAQAASRGPPARAAARRRGAFFRGAAAPGGEEEEEGPWPAAGAPRRRRRRPPRRTSPPAAAAQGSPPRAGPLRAAGAGGGAPRTEGPAAEAVEEEPHGSRGRPRRPPPTGPAPSPPRPSARPLGRSGFCAEEEEEGVCWEGGFLEAACETRGRVSVFSRGPSRCSGSWSPRQALPHPSARRAERAGELLGTTRAGQGKTRLRASVLRIRGEDPAFFFLQRGIPLRAGLGGPVRLRPPRRLRRAVRRETPRSPPPPELGLQEARRLFRGRLRGAWGGLFGGGGDPTPQPGPRFRPGAPHFALIRLRPAG